MKEIANDREVIHQYIKRNVNGNKAKVGVMVGTKDKDGILKLGWSKANTSAGDTFDKVRGYQLAKERCAARRTVAIPRGIYNEFYEFYERCTKYFKTKRLMGGSLPVQ